MASHSLIIAFHS